MSNDTMPCGCEGHADNASLCRYPEMKERAEQAEREVTIQRQRAEASENDLLAALVRAERAESAVSALSSEMEEERRTVAELRQERDAAREAASGQQLLYLEVESKLERADADNAALLALLRSGDMHRWEGSCPETETDTSRDPTCPGCRLLSHDHPGAALLERMRALETLADAVRDYLQPEPNREHNLFPVRNALAALKVPRE